MPPKMSEKGIAVLRFRLSQNNYICTFMKYIAQVISFVFHPLIIITYLLLLLLIINPYLFSIQNEKALGILMIYVVMLTIVMPGITVLLMKAMGCVTLQRVESSYSHLTETQTRTDTHCCQRNISCFDTAH